MQPLVSININFSNWPGDLLLQDGSVKRSVERAQGDGGELQHRQGSETATSEISSLTPSEAQKV